MSIKVEATGPNGYTTWNWYISADQPTLHREDGPAVEVFDPEGTKIEEQWVQHGQFHRTDGPAVIGYGFTTTYEEITETDEDGNEQIVDVIETQEPAEFPEYWINPGIQNGGEPTESIRVEQLAALRDDSPEWLQKLLKGAEAAGYSGKRIENGE